MSDKTKVVFSDLDSTLLRDDHRFSEYTKEIINEFCNKGGIFIPISARSINNVMMLARVMGILKYDGFLVAHNGGQIYDIKNDLMIVDEFVSKEIIKDIFEKTYGKVGKYKIHFFADKVTYSYGKAKNTEYWANVTKKEFKIIKNLDEIKDSIYLVTFILNENASEIDVEEMHNTFKYDYTQFHKYTNRVYELTPVTTSKGAAVEVVMNELKKRGLDIETYAFGDGANDITMFEKADHPIAMQNAVDILKTKAKKETKTNNNDGVATYIKENIVKY
ncbi:HAD superfamily hydrolase [Spiroplasma sp. TIUS-1]|uniref:HAD-IIB family hydrolase n=1 Tax=Spiroplasma sp. TIUS-1 TaxID=216963 RepID=UPI00139815E3|nr:HAD family hydrolase [Spiroplasma sp. TIUS-1]QHX35663.1 HAD superfamily hydrolase [Spiroplasma sp. TIUS-1]